MPGWSTTIWLMTLLSIGAAADNQGWFAVPRGSYIDFNLENIPLEIKTNSAIGSGDEVDVRFYTVQLENPGGVKIRFTSPPQYYISSCSTDWNDFTTNLPTATDKVWRITLTRTSGIRVVLHCNEVEVVNILFSDSTCKQYWREHHWESWRGIKILVTKIQFSSDNDTASHYYRPIRGNCTGLKAEWKSTMETTTQFPVVPGTVVEVTCSESGNTNKGSSAVTCVIGTGFSYTVEPSCSKPGWFAIQRGVWIDYDLETTPLEIKTNSEIGSGDKLKLWFYNSQGDHGGDIEIRFTSPPQYEIWPCTYSWTNFTTNLPTATDKVWRITLNRTSGIRLVIHCNEVEVGNILFSNSTCTQNGWSYWNKYWSRKVEKINFYYPEDTASDLYRPMGEIKVTATPAYLDLGTEFDLSCKIFSNVSDLSTPTVRWKLTGKDGVEKTLTLQTDHFKYSVATAAATDMGVYKCEVDFKDNTGIKTLAEKVTVYVRSTPVFSIAATPATNFRAPSTVLVGVPITLNCMFSGDPIGDVSWYKGNVILTDREAYDLPNATATPYGATSTATIKNVLDERYEGEYKCKANYTEGNKETESNPLTLAILGATDVTSSKQYSNKGDRITFRCNYLENTGDGSPASWVIPGVTSPTASSNSATLSVYKLTSATVENNGIVKCKVTYSNSLTNEVQVEQYVRDAVFQNVIAGKLYGLKGKQAVLTCVIHGDKLKGDVKWDAEGTTKTEAYTSASTKSTLTLSSVKDSDEKDYTCSGAYAEGEAKATAKQALTVLKVTVTGTATVNKGGDTTLTCDPVDVADTFSWKKGANPIPNQTSNTMILTGVDFTAAADYKCVVVYQHSLGTLKSEAYSVFVQGFVSLVQINKAGTYNEIGETITLKATIRSQSKPGGFKLLKKDATDTLTKTGNPTQKANKDWEVELEFKATKVDDASKKVVYKVVAEQTGNIEATIELQIFEATCLELSAPEHGSISCSGTGNIKNSCTVSCNRGYTYLGQKTTVTCQESLRWSHQSNTNSQGNFAACAQIQTPKSRVLEVELLLDVDYCKTDQEQTSVVSAFETYIKSGTAAVPCLTGSKCTVQKTSCNNRDKSSKITFELKQTGDLSSAGSLTSSSTRIKELVNSKAMSFEATTSKKRATTTFTAQSGSYNLKTTCDSGLTPVSDTCITCPAGHYISGGSIKVCTACSVGTYSTAPDSQACEKCGTGLTTYGEGSTGSQACKKLCKVPGPVSNGTMSPPTGYNVPPETLIKLTCDIGYTLDLGKKEFVCGIDTTPTCKEEDEGISTTVIIVVVVVVVVVLILVGVVAFVVIRKKKLSSSTTEQSVGMSSNKVPVSTEKEYSENI